MFGRREINRMDREEIISKLVKSLGFDDSDFTMIGKALDAFGDCDMLMENSRVTICVADDYLNPDEFRDYLKDNNISTSDGRFEHSQGSVICRYVQGKVCLSAEGIPF